MLNHLRAHPLFLPLSEEIMTELASVAIPTLVQSGKKYTSHSGTLGYLNLIVRGRWSVAHKNLADQEEEKNVEAGGIFGDIDSLLGSGAFVHATCLADSQILVFQLQDLHKITQKNAEFRNAVLAYRATLAMQKPTAPTTEQKAPQEGIRINRRAVVQGGALYIQLPDNTRQEIRDVSVNGLYVLGKPMGAPLQTVSLRIHATLPGVPEVMEQTGKIARIQNDGVGIHLEFLSAQKKAEWEDVVVRVTSLELAEVFQSKLTLLQSVLPIRFQREGKYVSASVTKLGSPGAVIGCQEELKLNEKIKIPFKFQQGANAAPRTFEAIAEVIRHQDAGYLVRFEQLTTTHQEWIEAFAQGVEPVEEKVSSEASKVTLKISNEAEFSEIYLREIKSGTLVLKEAAQLKVGGEVSVAIDVTGKKFVVAGEVIRKGGASSSVVRLKPLSAATQGRMEALLKLGQKVKLGDKNAHEEISAKAAYTLSFIMFCLGLVFLWFSLHSCDVLDEFLRASG